MVSDAIFVEGKIAKIMELWLTLNPCNCHRGRILTTEMSFERHLY